MWCMVQCILCPLRRQIADSESTRPLVVVVLMPWSISAFALAHCGPSYECVHFINAVL